MSGRRAAGSLCPRTRWIAVRLLLVARRAFREVTQAAERLARTCNVPVDQVTG